MTFITSDFIDLISPLDFSSSHCSPHYTFYLSSYWILDSAFFPTFSLACGAPITFLTACLASTWCFLLSPLLLHISYLSIILVHFRYFPFCI
jgi:hypothetical protein